MKDDSKKNHSSGFKDKLRVGFFLAFRQVKRANIWTNVLIICIMTLTFLNLVVVSGILVGLIEGAVVAVKDRYLGDIFISDLNNKAYIDRSTDIINFAQGMPEVTALTGRYIEGGTIESDYKELKKHPTDLDKSVGTSFAGINPQAEDKVSGISQLIIEGEYLDSDDYDQVLVGALLLKKYLDFESPNFLTLDNIEPGNRVKITVNGKSREVVVKGILKSKVDEIDRRVFFVDSQLRGLIDRYDYNVDEIVLRLVPGTNPIAVKNTLISAGFDKYARIQTQEDAEPKFIKDMKKTFNLLGAIISSIGLVVAAITIFIVIFINAITRRKFIGILKGIGIHQRTIEIAYIFQSVFYAVLGSALGTALVFLVLKPYFDKYPINFPFSDGILVATAEGTVIRIVVLIITTLIAGYVPARMVAKQNTLDAILGR